ncbi:response regulator transcription factor (plasmid) [Vibrio sp. HDW18]|uniref:LytR/AlgR family response regulator transcription factor n=1 Tax=Vibrio TaxID=662 RepID=UPI001408E2C6|nr:MULTISPECIES: LytTR family DNA-binding domain-containing protein [unclassified Vibrio]QIL86627.1 response regulator transcription factor [Vibrio sp. HDW18]
MIHRTCKAVLADDEPILCHHLNQLLAEVWPTLEVVATAANGEQALAAITHHLPDIVFLDIRMPKLSGIEVARELLHLPKIPLVVFITAYDEYALSAFETNAIDYLLKPLSLSRLVLCCEKLQRQWSFCHAPQADLNQLLSQFEQITGGRVQYPLWLKASKREEIHLISVSDVLYVKAQDKYLSLYKSDGTTIQEYLLRSSLKELTTQLDPNQFWQIHRSLVVNIAKINKVKRDFNGKMWVHIDSAVLPVSRALQHLFKVS